MCVGVCVVPAMRVGDSHGRLNFFPLLQIKFGAQRKTTEQKHLQPPWHESSAHLSMQA